MKEEIKYVVDNSKYVSIDYNRVNDFVKDLGKPKYEHWYKEIDLKLNDKERILLAFIIESMNFCFWQKPKWKIEYHGDIVSGSNALFYSVIREVENNSKFLNVEYLYNLTKEDFEKIFEAVEGNVPLIDERYSNFKEAVNFVHNNNNFYNDLYNIKSDVELLNYITSNLTSFDDKSMYKGKIIHFNKRATLLANDLFYMSETIRKNLGNVNNLSGCADYGIPRTFRDYGILKYSKELKELIDNEKEIMHDSEMEIEIRANMLYVIELIKEELKNNNILINSVELDNLIWWIGKKNKDRKSVAQHTITIFY